jgi:hypothetical protein
MQQAESTGRRKIATAVPTADNSYLPIILPACCQIKKVAPERHLLQAVIMCN